MSRRWLLTLVPLVLTTVAAGLRAEPPGKLLKEVWEAAYLEGSPVGHLHATYRQVTLNDQPLIEAASEMDLTLTRFQQQLRLTFSMADYETPEGRILSLAIRQPLGKDQQLVRKGRLEGQHLVMSIQTGNAAPQEKRIPWGERVLGLYAEEELFRTRPPQPQTTFDYQKFVPEFDTVLKVTVEVKGPEEVALLRGLKKRLLRTESRLEKVMNIELPATVAWVDETGDALKRQTEIGGLGKLVTYRTTRDVALGRAPAPPSPPAVDIGTGQLIRLDKAIPRPHETREVVYRVRLKGVDDPTTAFVSDERQEIRNVQGDQFEIVVRGLQTPDAAAGTAAEPPAQALASNHFIRSDDARVKQLAAQAVGGEREPWKKAQRIERWVHDHLENKNFSQAFATADEVARTLEGDCTEHTVLAAAMCRAAGVPSRTAVGLVYVPQARAMGFHMWLEVWVGGRWYALDPTLGQGRVAAAHLKITHSDWHETMSLTPLLPVNRVLGKLSLDVVSVK
jgi:transglutaminase-like putative cysteine protease